MTNPPSDILEALAAPLGAVDAAIKSCPVQGGHFGDRLCPKCGATTSQGCGQIDSAEHYVVIAVRQLLAELKATPLQSPPVEQEEEVGRPCGQPATHEPSLAARLGPAGECQAQETLRELVLWTEAYPVEWFPEPDMELVTKILRDHGHLEQIDRMHASWARHLMNGFRQLAASGLTSDSGRHSQSRDSEAARAESCQSGGETASPIPTPPPSTEGVE